jgi:hypothetical protein
MQPLAVRGNLLPRVVFVTHIHQNLIVTQILLKIKTPPLVIASVNGLIPNAILVVLNAIIFRLMMMMILYYPLTLKSLTNESKK